MRVRFGIFEFDPQARELRRDGVEVRLQAQPAQVLALLIARAGETVTREELREAVWGSDTFVDFDRGLNFCIAQVRSALGDSAESPRFVRTIPKRGYQFIAPVIRPAAPVRPALKRALRFLIPALAGAMAIFAGVTLLRPTAIVNIAVTRFDNETGDPALDRFADSLSDSVVAELTASTAGRYGIIGNAAIVRGPRAQRDLAAIAGSLHAGYIVLGQVQRDGAGLRVLAHLIRFPGQTHLTVARLECRAEDSTARLAERISAQLTSRLPGLSKAATN